jgi:hypothetical protein
VVAEVTWEEVGGVGEAPGALEEMEGDGGREGDSDAADVMGALGDSAEDSGSGVAAKDWVVGVEMGCVLGEGGTA